MNPEELREALILLIRGTEVRRASHELSIGGEDATSLFVKLLQEEGYLPATVKKVRIEPGERVPAFYVKDATAHFGWVFWEMFFPDRMRKLFGSAHHNEKGDWAIMLGRGSRETIYANMKLKEATDLHRPSSF